MAIFYDGSMLSHYLESFAKIMCICFELKNVMEYR
jgi:hypothetical protein